jgi:hypothetical protein
MNHAIKRGVHTFSKYLGATTKLQATERWCEGNYILKIHK